MPLEIYGMLHIAQGAGRPVNLTGGGDPIDIYLRCAALCARSMEASGYRFRLVTNEGARVAARIAALGLDGPELLDHAFGWDVPAGIGFRSAHFKLELYEAFGTGAFGAHVCLVDLDTVLLRPFPDHLLSAPGLVGYDMTAQEVRDYGEPAIAGAIVAVAGTPLPATWWGGEFLMGRADDFAALAARIATVWPRYVAAWQGLHHQGDEALTSAAIALMRRDGAAIVDAGAAGGVARWWSARTLAPRPTLAEACRASLLHLPADKAFLAGQGDGRGFAPTAFLRAYRGVARRRALVRRLVGAVDRVRGRRPRKFAPRIGAWRG